MGGGWSRPLEAFIVCEYGGVAKQKKSEFGPGVEVLLCQSVRLAKLIGNSGPTNGANSGAVRPKLLYILEVIEPLEGASSR